MHCLKTNKVLSPDDLEVDLVIMVHSVRPILTSHWFDSDSKSYQQLWQSQTSSFIGIPMVIKSLCLPFMFCERLDTPNGGGRAYVDTRSYKFMSVTKDFARAVSPQGTQIVERQPERPLVYKTIRKLYRHHIPRRMSMICDSKGRPHVYQVAHEE